MAMGGEMKNDQYRLTLEEDHSFILSLADGTSQRFRMEFAVLFTGDDPKTSLTRGNVGRSYNLVSWHNGGTEGDKSILDAISETAGHNFVGDGFDPKILQSSKKGRTVNVFQSAPQVVVSALSVQVQEGGWRFAFPEHPYFELSAELSLPENAEPPRLRYELTPKRSGYFSVGYVGAPSRSADAMDELWQPLLWQEKRLPADSFLTLAYRCPVPSALVAAEGHTLGVVVDPAEFPFMPLPTFANSRFGVAVRTLDDKFAPMVFAPVLGLPGSKMKLGRSFSFVLRPVLIKGDTTVAVEAIARELYGFHDYRQNALCSLNTTLENMIEYGMSKWSRFLEEQKGCSYATDAPGTVKNVSSLNPMSLAIVTDSEEIFTRRAYPYMEYMLSRGKFLFTTDREQKIQSPSYTLDGPCAPISELTSLYETFGKGTAAFMELAESEYLGSRGRNLDVEVTGKSWLNAIFMFKATGEKAYLDLARSGADAYIERRIDAASTSFDDPDAGGGFFWTQFAPRFAHLLELYEITGEERYLEASRKAARRMVQFTYLTPRIPDGAVTVNKGGMAPHYYYLKNKGHKRMSCPEETVPAWRLSAIGLTPESSGTSHGHRAIFMANHAPWLIRIGYLSGDDFLREVGRSAIIGRYRNFPGYHINTERTTVYEKADYPLRSHEELSANSFHYNHIWPMMSMLLDYLVSETTARSQGRIDFPAQFIEGYAYLQNKFYGAQKGRFYDHDDAILWMPKQLLTIDSVEVNYIAARGENDLYLAFLNESPQPVTAQVTLDAKRVPDGEYDLYVREENADEVASGTANGSFPVTIAARGITSVRLAGLRVKPAFQPKVMGLDDSNRWAQGLVSVEEPAGRAMVLNLGELVQNGYVFLKDGAEDFQTVELVYDLGEGPVVMRDESFPFEFTFPLGDKAERVSFLISGLTKDGRRVNSGPHQLYQRAAAPLNGEMLLNALDARADGE